MCINKINHPSSSSNYSNPNLGTRQLPIVVGNVDSLPTWPRYSNGKEEFLDMDSFSQTTVRKSIRDKHCDFLMDPEGFLKREETTSASTRDFFTLYTYLIAVKIALLFVW